MMRRPSFLLALTLALAGCGYFNSLYNANRRFADAERASARGDASARAAYYESIEKAAVSYRGHPDGRWADDALLLIGRARFALREDPEAVAALQRVLAQTSSDDVAALARVYLGAAFARQQQYDSASIHLERAAAHFGPRSELGALARLWRARVAFAQARPAAAWRDLDDAREARGPHAVDIALETAARAVEQDDSVRFSAALARLASLRAGERAVDAVQQVLTRAAARWSAADVLALGAPLERAVWSADAAHRLTLFRAQLAVQAGDSAVGVNLAMRVAENVRGGFGSAARLMVARWRLAALDDPAELEGVRALLLPAFDELPALELQRQLRAAQILIERGATPSTALSLFAAAEHARDELAAPRLARSLFLEFARIAAGTVWAGKAVLAAAAIAPDADTERALSEHADNVYVRAARGEPTGEEFTVSEQRLARGLAGLHAEALALAAARDVVVGRAITVLDSTRAVARSDSMRIVCGAMIDSLRVAGIRADSTRSACLRGDSVRVAFVLRADTTVLLDSAAVRNAGGRPRPAAARPDTTTRRP